MTQSREGILAAPVSGRDHAMGAADAPVTLVEYGDYQCPDCGDAYAIVKAVQARMGSALRFVFRNFPLEDMHAYARNAAEAAEAAGAQDKFWPMYDLLFEHQRALQDRQLLEYAGEAGADPKLFEKALTQHSYAQRVDEDLESGERSGVGGTPTFFINGVRYEGDYDEAGLLAALNAAGTGGK